MSVNPSSAIMAVSSVGILNVNGNQFAEIAYGFSGASMSVLIEGKDPVESLFASADAEFEAARAAMRRAMRMRNAAWKLSKDRANSKAA